MNGRTLIKRSLRYHWRSHLGVVLGAAVATAVLVGALAVGDSVRYSLLSSAESRLGAIQVAMISPNRFLNIRTGGVTVKAGRIEDLVQVRGIASRPDGTARLNDCQVVGYDPGFFFLGLDRREMEWRAREELRPDGPPGSYLMLKEYPEIKSPNGVAINELVARDLGLKVGDEFILRMEKPGALPIDAPLADPSTAIVAQRVTVEAIVSRQRLGNFSLAANQVPPRNIFVPRNRLWEWLNLQNQCNIIVGAEVETPDPSWKPTPSILDGIPIIGPWFAEKQPVIVKPASVAAADKYLDQKFTLYTVGLHVGADPYAAGSIAVTSDRIFLDPPVAPAALTADPAAVGVLTYFVNELKVDGRATPYSMVTAVGPLSAKPEDAAAARKACPLLSLLPEDMKDDDIVLNQWLAEDLAAKSGDEIEMSYFVIGAGNRLVTKPSKFKVRAVVPIAGAAADRNLMPWFPGIADVNNCRDWHTGFPIDLTKIRDKDQTYWDQHRGTPKAFVTLAAGQRMWGNRFGDLTAIRCPSGEPEVRKALKERLKPSDFGFFFQPVRERAMAAATKGIDFGQLFLGLSLFLVLAALLLTGLLFGFGVQSRAAEVGTLLALGLPPRRVRRLMLAEGAILAAIGGIVGAAAGLLYTAGALWALSTVWSGAVGGSDLLFHADPLTVAGGAAAGFVVALVTIWLTVFRQARAPARELMASGAEAELRLTVPRPVRRWVGPAILILGLGGAAAIFVAASGMRGEAVAVMVFGAGALLLVAGLGACRMILSTVGRSRAGRSLRAGPLGVRGATRRAGRSLATVALLACGVFLVITVGANRRDPMHEAALRSSGTGGFALFGQTTVPVMRDLNTPEGRKAFGLPEDLKDKMKVVAVRVHEGDDASCLNLNRPQQPRVIGVPVDALAERGAFGFAEAPGAPAGESPWHILKNPAAEGSVPTVADQTTLEWALSKSVGQDIALVDDRGRPFAASVVGALQNSILQGSVILSEESFLKKYPGSGGYRMLLIDVTPGHEAEVSQVLSRQMGDVGLALVPASERLAEFNTVENTYLAIFQALGGLALALGSIGLGVVVLRNVLERRGELALLRAVGFRRRAIQWMVLSEHWALLVMGLVCGTVAGLGAVMPLVTAAGTAVPYLSLGITLAAVFVAGLVWTWLATRLALKGPLMEALRSE